MVLSQKTQQALADFTCYAKFNIPSLIANAKLLYKLFPKDLRNPVMCFLLNSTVTHITEHLILRVQESWKLVEIASRKVNEKELDNCDSDYKDLDIMRDKLLAHRVQVEASTDKYSMWYKKKYGTNDNSVFELIQKVSIKVVNKIEELINKKHITVKQTSSAPQILIKEIDIEKIISALKSHQIY